MIRVVPALDLINGQCVRLCQGDYEQQKTYYANPLDFVREIVEAGFQQLHLVDLDGAKAGEVKNLSLLTAIKKTYPKLRIDFGGGITSVDVAIRVVDAGADQISIGSLATKNPEMTNRIIKRISPARVILAADVKDRMIAVNAWKDLTNVSLSQFVEDYRQQGVEHFLCTDISRDGMLSGPALDLYDQILQEFKGLQLIASGGVASYQDVEKLNSLSVPAVVIGKAILEGHLDLLELHKQYPIS